MVRLGAELRLARTAAGLSIDQVAKALGISNAEVSRIERALSPRVPFVTLARFAAVVGLDLAAKLYPGATPVRDLPQAELIGDFRSLLHPVLLWAAEVHLPIPGDQRAWDALVSGTGWRFGVEAETAPRDGQAIARRIHLEERDGDVDGVVLIVRDTRTTREFLAGAAEYLAPQFPVRSREALLHLRRGGRPPGNAIVVVPRRRRPP